MSDVLSARIEVLLPVRAPAPWLTETLDGLRAQSASNWSLTVLVHGDPDGIPQVVTDAIPDANVVLLSSSLSFVDVLNTGLRSGTAPYVARIDADDVPESHRLDTQRKYLEEHAGCVLVCSRITRIDAMGGPAGIYPADSTASNVMRLLRWKNVIPHPTVMARRTDLLEVGGYDVSATHAEDYELWLRLAARGEIAMLPDPLIQYRVHEGQVTRTKTIPPLARRAVGQARINLARSRNESILAARLRQAIWSARQGTRAITRGGS